jgi:hypothetical protein
MKMKLDLDIKKWLPVLRKAQPYVFGIVLIGVFGYTAYIVNASLNVQASTTVVTVPAPASAVTFDKSAITTVKNLQVVQGTVVTGELGKSDPFK